MRNQYVITVFIFLLTACTNNPSITESEIRHEILNKGNNIVRALNEADIEGLYRDIWQFTCWSLRSALPY